MMLKRKWKLTLIAFVMFSGIFTFNLSAQSQWDITLNVPYYAGVKALGGEMGAFSDYMFVLPDIKWNYYFGPEVFHVGVGFRLWTLLLESAVYPAVSFESNLGNFVINANVGGWAFGVFGLYNDFVTGNVFFPEVSVAYKLGKKKRFSLGTSALFMIMPDLGSDAFVFVGSGFARWTF